MSADTIRVQVLLPNAEAERLNDYCRERGYKKSTLIARLIREHLNNENFPMQPNLFQPASKERSSRK